MITRAFGLLCMLGVIFSFSSCSEKRKNIESSNKDILSEIKDTTIVPGDDFFSYACGKWLKNNPIPEIESSWGIANLVVDQNYKRLREICERAAGKNANRSPQEKRIGDFWKEAMDSAKCNSLGMAPIVPELAKIDSIKSKEELLEHMALYQSYAIGAGFDIYIGQDDKNSSRMRLYLVQGGIGLPNRDYYFNKDARTTGLRDVYKKHIAQQLSNINISNADKISESIYLLEEKFAGASKKLEDLRDPYANYNPFSVKDLNKLTPGFNWDTYLHKANLMQDTVIVGQPAFFKTFQKEFEKTPLDVWKNYLKWNLVRSFSGTLNHTIDSTHFAFYGMKIRGMEKQRPRWKRSLSAIENALGDDLGQEYVKLYFSPTAKLRYEKMVEDVRSAFRNHIQQLTWMRDSTKVKAIDKLDRMGKKVGYPEKWKDFSSMKIDTSSYFHNILEYRKWEYRDQLEKLNKPVDRTVWDMTPQTYNAYYNPSNNEIVLPAAIFSVPGFADEELDDALVYGYAGASTIGHEITHGFDDQGRLYDADGNLNNWWSQEDSDMFNKETQKLVSLFNSFVLLDSMHLNGKATLGENIADLGGVVLGLDAFKQSLQYKSGKSLGGMTPVQRYFLGYALGWMGHQRNESLADQILTDVHSPAKYRVNGPFMNVPEFYSAFNIKPGDKMFIADSLRAIIW